MARNHLSLRVLFLGLVLICLAALAACAPTLAAQPRLPAPATAAALVPTLQASAAHSLPKPNLTGIPAFSHVYLIVMENKGFDGIVGSASAPYVNSLIAQYGLATEYTAIGHPSQPNYIALFSGSIQGIKGDGVVNLNAVNLADQLEAAGKTWKVYAQNYPGSCFRGAEASGGQDGPGNYARKHNPAISFTSISESPARCANITDLKHFDAQAANYELIIPNQCNDMHDCSIDVGDNFLKDFVPQILNTPAWQNGGVLFITWDEGEEKQPGADRVPLLVISKEVQPRFQSSTPHNHYSLLRTIEDAWGLPCLNLSCQANNLAEFFR